MAGRKPKLNWTPSVGQYTTTVDGVFHRLGTDREQAETQFRWLLNKQDLGESADSNPFVSDVLDAWLIKHVKQKHDPERYRLCRARLEEFVAFIGENLRVKELRARHVEKWIESKPNARKPGTIRLYKAMVLAALNWAAGKKVRMIPSNPLKGMLELPEGDSRGGEALWSPKVFKLVLANVNSRFGDFLRALAWTGARPSTVRRVEARHYNPDLRLWDVDDLYRGRRHSKKVVRRIWLPPQMIPMVEKLNAEYPSGPIFRNTRGKPYTGDVVTMMMFKLRRRLKKKRKKIPKSLCVYGLRHTFATTFIREHPDKLEYLRELLGHKDMQMIRRHYGHLFDEHNALHDVLDGLPPLDD
jgi:integrase